MSERDQPRKIHFSDNPSASNLFILVAIGSRNKKAPGIASLASIRRVPRARARNGAFRWRVPERLASAPCTSIFRRVRGKGVRDCTIEGSRSSVPANVPAEINFQARALSNFQKSAAAARGRRGRRGEQPRVYTAPLSHYSFSVDGREHSETRAHYEPSVSQVHAYVFASVHTSAG